MVAMYQYRDLPQIPGFSEELQYPSWGHDHMAYQQQSFRVEEDYESGRVSGGVQMRTQALGRFLVEPSPLTQGLLNAKLDRYMPHYNQHIERYEQWPAPEHARHDSPDTSESCNSSYATQNELRSPLPYHSVSYGSPEEYTQASFPYPSGDHLREPSYSRDLPLPGGPLGSISLRDLEYEHEPEPEPIIEEVEPVDLKTDVAYEQESVCKMESTPTIYREYSDSSNSLRDGESVQPIGPSEDETSDTEYTPNRSSRRRRSSASTKSSGSTGQRRRSHHGRRNSSTTTPTHRVNKRGGRSTASSSTGKGFSDSHLNGDSQRHFPCPLATYGCQSTFSSKNEWKRHVSTQHIKLGFWRCNLCVTTVDPHDEHTIYHNDFNRKDLFTQHLRRMHATPTSSSQRTQKEYPVNEDNIADHQKWCFQTLRSTPQRSQCLFCHERFEGPTSWENRMEHIGRHLEKDRKDGFKLGNVESWIVDKELEQWLLDEGIIAVDQGGRWKLGDGKPRRTAYAEMDNSFSDADAAMDDRMRVHPHFHP
ncbi:hypothetical protein K458DRAFT_444096 [Lentithecium fluviatile CBS 122367]|uniref:C2H2-type domain-containing protein n=1 Tax=Lentithecium fluviatile CBS 122367 TaxID=1168545 RepID=A0A6G1IVZ4_9PLEO|nr:hypothetical protein K458DRAFT_444096 [Lentithecium fluviatile CBS 122367]